jgi:hypothetical protein
MWNIGLGLAIVLASAQPWIGTMITFAGLINLGYMGKRSAQIMKEQGLSK